MRSGLRVATLEEVAAYGNTLPPGLVPPIAGASGQAVVQSGAGVNTTAGNSVVITLGVAPTAGNLQIAALDVSQYNETRTCTPPGTGWTTIDNGTTNTWDALYVFWREFAPGDGTSWTFTMSGTAEWITGVMYEISGADTTNPVNQYPADTIATDATTVSSPGATPSVIGTLALAFLACDHGSANASSVSAVSSGWTLDQDAIPQYHQIACASRSALTTDTTTAISNTFTVSAPFYEVAGTLLVNPAAPTVLPPRPVIWPQAMWRSAYH